MGKSIILKYCKRSSVKLLLFYFAHCIILTDSLLRRLIMKTATLKLNTVSETIYIKQEPYVGDDGIYVPCEPYVPEGCLGAYDC
jgi:hypothetical protein